MAADAAPRLVLLPPRAAEEDVSDPSHRPGLHAALTQAVAAFSSGAGLDMVLLRLESLIEETTGGFCSTLLFDPATRRLIPVVSSAEPSDPELKLAFERLPPIELTRERWDLLQNMSAIGIDDVCKVEWFPRDLAERFNLHSMILARMKMGERIVGILTVNFGAEPHQIEHHELELVAGIAELAAAAVVTAELYEQTRRDSEIKSRLYEAVRALNAAKELEDALAAILDGIEALLEPVHTSVNLWHADTREIETVAFRGIEPPFKGRFRLEWFVKDPVAIAKADTWIQNPEPWFYPDETDVRVEAPEGVSSAMVIPMCGPEGLLGIVLAAFAEQQPIAADMREIVAAFADQASVAVNKAMLGQATQERVRELGVLYELSSLLLAGLDLEDLIPRINAVLRTSLGCEIVGADALEDDLGLPPLSAGEAGDLDIALPMVDGVSLGAVRVRQCEGSTARIPPSLLTAIATSLAQMLARVLGTHREKEAARELAIAGERERIARDLHDTLGQIFFSMGLAISGCEPDVESELNRSALLTLRDLARDGMEELRKVVYALSFLDIERGDLLRSLGELATRFGAAFEVRTNFRVLHLDATLTAQVEELVFRAAREALVNVERHAHARSVWITLDVSRSGVTLVVEDDGKGPAEAPSGGGHFGLRRLRAAVAELDGRVSLSARHPSGTVFTLELPLR